MVCKKLEKGLEQKEKFARSKIWTEKKVYICNGRAKKDKATKVKRYVNRIKQFQDNRNFQTKHFSKIVKVKRKGQNREMLKMQQHFGKEYG